MNDDRAAGKGDVRFSRAALERVVAHAEETYPRECFGFLLGRFDDRRVQEARPGRNVNATRSHDRYEMEPREFLQIQAETRGGDEEIVGFYHSHPDDTAVPSAYDRERAWEEYLYLIVSVADGRAGEARLWRLEAPDGGFSMISYTSSREEGRTDVCDRSHSGPAARQGGGSTSD